MSNIPVITVDGPSGSGKGTLCQWLSKQLGWGLLDSGALYRLTALAATEQGVDFNDHAALADVALNLDVTFDPSGDDGVITLLSGQNVGTVLRTEETGALASQVASVQAVRDALLARQRAFRDGKGLVADGRDMGTVVFKDAPLKVFLTASAEERANRRFKQLKNKGLDANLRTLLDDIEARDERDRNRSASPLVPADDAIQIDSTELDIDAICAKVLNLAKNKGLC